MKIHSRLALVGSLVLLSCCSAISSPPLVAQQEPAEKTTTWLIVRHAEKDANEILTDEGKLRAEKLKKMAELFRIKAVYSTDYPRTKDTAKPTADELDVKIQLYKKTDQKWFDEMKKKHNGQAVLIVGHSNTIGAIAKGLGGDGDFSVVYEDYDNLFVVTNHPSGSRSLRLKFGN